MKEEKRRYVCHHTGLPHVPRERSHGNIVAVFQIVCAPRIFWCFVEKGAIWNTPRVPATAHTSASPPLLRARWAPAGATSPHRKRWLNRCFSEAPAGTVEQQRHYGETRRSYLFLCSRHHLLTACTLPVPPSFFFQNAACTSHDVPVPEELHQSCQWVSAVMFLICPSVL